MVAVGECGTDYDRMFSSKEDQKQVFRAHMEIASQYNLPVFLHCRDKVENGQRFIECHQDFLAILKEFPTVKKVVHCFTDDRLNVLQDLLRQPFTYIGITGWITDSRRGNKKLLFLVTNI